jgi:hypothetical protein
VFDILDAKVGVGVRGRTFATKSHSNREHRCLCGYLQRLMWMGQVIARFRMGAFNITLYTETSRLKALNVPECRGHASPCPACPEC